MHHEGTATGAFHTMATLCQWPKTTKQFWSLLTWAHQRHYLWPKSLAISLRQIIS